MTGPEMAIILCLDQMKFGLTIVRTKKGVKYLMTPIFKLNEKEN